MTNAPLLNKVMFYVGSLECDFKSPTVTERILNTALVLSDFRRQQSILMLTDDEESLHWIQQRELRLSRQRVKQNSLHSQTKVKMKNTVNEKITLDRYSGVCGLLSALRCGCEKGPHQSAAKSWYLRQTATVPRVAQPRVGAGSTRVI